MITVILGTKSLETKEGKKLYMLQLGSGNEIFISEQEHEEYSKPEYRYCNVAVTSNKIKTKAGSFFTRHTVIPMRLGIG